MQGNAVFNGLTLFRILCFIVLKRFCPVGDLPYWIGCCCLTIPACIRRGNFCGATGDVGLYGLQVEDQAHPLRPAALRR